MIPYSAPSNRPKNFRQAEAFLARAKDGRDWRKITANLTIHRIDDDTIAAQYHRTDIVTWTRKGYSTLRTGGWATLHTFAWMEELMDSPKVWAYAHQTVPFIKIYGTNSKTVPLEHGMVIGPRGGVRYQGTPPDVAGLNRLNALILRYVDEYIAWIAVHGHAKLHKGCFYCQDSFDETSSEWVMLAETDNLGHEHMLLHMRNMYFPKELIGMMLYYFPQASRPWEHGLSEIKRSRPDFWTKSLKNFLRRTIRRMLGLFCSR